MPFRFATPEDAPQLLAIYAPYVLTTPYTFEYTVPTVEEFAQRIADINEAYPYLVYTEGDTLLGYAYAHRYMERAAFSWDVEVSIYLAPTAQGRGLGRALYTKLFQLLALQNLKQAYALITSSNTGSLRMHEALGFKAFATFPKVGYKLAAWHDLVYLHRELNTAECAPEPMLSIHDLAPQKVQAILNS